MVEQYANECYFVCPNVIIDVDEVPEGWGLINLVKNGLRTIKRAKQRQVESLPMKFITSLARHSSLPESSLPKIAWLWAGKELDEKELLEAADISVQRIKKDYELKYGQSDA